MGFSTFRLVLAAALVIVLQLTPLSSAQEIVDSHAFSGAELTAHPEENWLTNGGNTFNQRFSPLSQINRYNVADLKAIWGALFPRHLSMTEVLLLRLISPPTP